MTGPAVPPVGEEIPPLRRTTGLDNWNRFAAVNDEFVPIHMNDDAGRAAGQSGAFGMGSLQYSYLHTLLREWLGPVGRILTVNCTFRGVNTKGMPVTARGRVARVGQEETTTVVGLDVWTEGPDGVLLAVGSAEVSLPTT